MGWVGLGPQQQVASVLVLKLPTWLRPPFCLFPGVRFPESCQDEVQDQKQLLKDAAAFLLFCQIPGLVREGLKSGGCRMGCCRLGASCSLVSYRIDPSYSFCISSF